MKISTNLLKISGIILAGLSLFALIAAGIILFILWQPEKILTSSNLKFMAIKIKPMGISVDWQSLGIQIKNYSLLDKNLDLEFKNLCMDIPSIKIKGCLQQLHVGAHLVFRNRKLRIAKIDPVLIVGENFLIDLRPSLTLPKPAGKPGIFSDIISRDTKFGDLQVILKDLKFVSGENTFSGELNIGSEKPFDPQNPRHLMGWIKAQEPKNKISLSTGFVLTPEHFQANLDFKKKKGISAVAHLLYSLSGTNAAIDEGGFKIDLETKINSQTRVVGIIQGRVKEDHVYADLNLKANVSGNRIFLGEEAKCQAKIGYKNELNGQIKLDCPVQVVPKTSQISGIELSKQFRAIGLVIKADLKSLTGLNTDGPWTGKAGIYIETKERSFLKIDGKVESQIERASLDENLLNNLSAQVDVKIALDQFRNLVEFLQNTDLGIPAPLNSLAGKIECNIKGDLKSSKLDLPYICTTKLDSKHEALELEARGNVKGVLKGNETHIDLVSDVSLNNIQLALPHFGIKGVPPLFPDPRFQKSIVPVDKKTAPAFDYVINLKTPAGKPVRILSNLVKDNIPMQFDLKIASNAPLVGAVNILEFPVVFFRREGTIKYFNVKLTPKENQLLNGLIEVHYTDYVIKITVEGSSKEPIVRFDSVPPLSQENIFSVLLFGHPADNLNPMDQSSVVSAQAAAADKAISLTSMYLLAFTPVESIGYNSQSQTFTAKFRLAEGTSLNVGAGNSGVKEVGINRHLGGPWYVYTFVKNPTDSDAHSTAAFLQWVLKY